MATLAMADAATMRVRVMMPPGHVRTPAYLRGKVGQVERILGPFSNPEDLAYRQPGARLHLYRVRFRMADLWGDACENADDTLDAEIYAHWLEEVEPAIAT